MRVLGKFVGVVLLAAASFIAVGASASDAEAHGYKKYYSYDTKFGSVGFKNFPGRHHWPVVRKFHSYGKHYKCHFWKSYYDCDRYYPKKAYYHKKKYYGGGYKKSHWGHKKGKFSFHFKKHY